jgi:hypothetical protein
MDKQHYNFAVSKGLYPLACYDCGQAIVIGDKVVSTTKIRTRTGTNAYKIRHERCARRVGLL